MKKYIQEQLKRISKNILFPLPSRLTQNFLHIEKEKLDSIENSIRKNYHTGWRSESNYSKENYKNDLNAHLLGRLENDRNMIIPWLDNAAPLQNKRILEIGCGTGSSTIALAEQGAFVTGIDIDEGALIVARERSEIYGMNVEFKVLNAQDIPGNFNSSSFDFIIFFACLEHMTTKERLSSLKCAWDLLPSGGYLVVVETPNRLWYFDGHTSLLPFFHWLPNELAFDYSKFSPRENFHDMYNEYNETSKEHFLRQGRGMSFHEFDIALGQVNKLNIVSSISTFKGIRYKLNRSKLERQYKSMLMSICPNIHEGFFDEYLYLIIKK
jgi:2-polyprenyl-3-methyl-5-hydroxy-6-metoxy-1,4-benzoquinol methylase